MTRTGDREIGSVSGRLPDNPGELACMLTAIALCCRLNLQVLYASIVERNASQVEATRDIELLNTIILIRPKSLCRL